MAGTIRFEGTGILQSDETLLPTPRDISIKSLTQTYKSASQNLSIETRSKGIQRWEVALNFPPLNREDAMKVYAFFINQQGTFDQFRLIMPQPLNTHSGSQVNIEIEGTPMVTDNRANLSRTVGVGNFNKGLTDALKAGDFFKFSNHDKVYMVTQDLVTDETTGTGTLSFTPPIISSVTAGTEGANNLISDGTTIEFVDIDWSMSLLEDEFEFPVDEHIHYVFNIKLGERVSYTDVV